MIVNFYRKTDTGLHGKKLVASKNIGCIPQKGMPVKFSGQCFCVDRIEFNINLCEYDIYMIRG